MSIHHTIDQLAALHLTGMAEAVRHQMSNASLQGLSFEDRLSMIVDAESQARETSKQRRLLKSAKLKVTASADDIDYGATRGLDRSVMSSLLACEWIQSCQNVLITGPTGAGKSWIACALGHQATRKGFTVLYKRASRLLEELDVAHAIGSLPEARGVIAKARLLILDDWGLVELNMRGRQDFLEIIDDRLGVGATIITSQLPVERWHDFIGDPTLADAILDRLVHTAHRIELCGESQRKLRSKRQGGAP